MKVLIEEYVHGREIEVSVLGNNKPRASLAIKTFQVLECKGMARVDMFLQPNGKILINEINTLPGFTNISMYHKLWEASGLSYR